MAIDIRTRTDIRLGSTIECVTDSWTLVFDSEVVQDVHFYVEEAIFSKEGSRPSECLLESLLMVALAESAEMEKMKHCWFALGDLQSLP